MTVSLSDIVDTLRWVWLLCGVVWIAYAWLHRFSYARTLFGLGALFVLDWFLHAFADFAEQPNSNLPSDFALYAVMLLLAALAGLTAACLYARWRGMNVTRVLEAALVCTIAGGIGGRALHVLTNWNYYSENTDLILELSHGGFGIRGALLFGFVALFLFARLTKNSFWQLADAAVIGLALAQSIGWYGASLTHAFYGVALDAAPPLGLFAPLAQSIRMFGYNFAQDLPDAYNLVAFRIPVQMLAAIFFFALFIFLLTRAHSNRAQTGSLFTAYCLLVSAANFLFGFWRGDETLQWNGLRLDQWVDLAFLLLGIALWWLQRAQTQQISRRIFQHA